MNLSDTITIPAQVMARQVGQETVILDLARAPTLAWTRWRAHLATDG